ncbi:MAG: M48 family metallopeptidase [Candidatus Micrarchaeia archaeon]
MRKIYAKYAAEPLDVSGKQLGVMEIVEDIAYARALVKDDTVYVYLPVRASSSLRRELSAKLRQSIAKKLARNPDAFKQISEPVFRDGEEVRALGRRFVVHITEGFAAKYSRAKLVGEDVFVWLASGVAESDKQKQASRLCRRVIAKSLCNDINERVEQVNKSSFGATLKKVSIMYARTVWGSCNAKTKTINLNFVLLFAPPEVLDYVIIHELAHMREQNHSKAFWSLVARAMPDYAKARAWLKKNGSSLG